MFTQPAFAQLQINLSSSNLLSKEYAVVYKPSKLIIGKENIFKIKSAPGNKVILMISGSNMGAEAFHNKILRLGNDAVSVEGVVPENGLLEMKFELPNKPDLNGKTAYFEVLSWSKEDFQDIQSAKIMGDDCKEISSNAIYISLPPADMSKPSLAPIIPMVPPEFMQAIDSAEKIKSGSKNEDYKEYLNENIFKTPAYIRNLKAPELINTP
jgi:hypothetical protein